MNLFRCLAVGLISALLLGACGDDPISAPADVALDAAGDASADAVDVAAPVDVPTARDLGPPDLGPIPEVVVVDPLPLAAGFDPAHVGVGDGVVTTLVETLRPRHGWDSYRTDDGGLRVPLSEYARLHPQPGEPHTLRDQLAWPAGVAAPDWTPGDLPEGSRSALYGFLLADPQIVDMDSPAQIPKNAANDFVSLPAYRPHAELAPMLGDALIRTANRLSQVRPFDAVLVMGDAAENGQTNELTWFLTMMNGGVVSPDSGARDDVVAGPGNDAYDAYLVEGIAPGTPWLQAIGNHDIQINGNFPPGLIEDINGDAEVQALLAEAAGELGFALPNVPTAGWHPAWLPHAQRGAFRVRMDDWFHPDQLTSDAELRATEAAEVPADPDRQAVGVCGYVGLHREASGVPAGHGFTDDNAQDCTGSFTWDPVPGLPLRFMSLAFGPVEGGDDGILAPPHDGGVPNVERIGDPRWDQIAFIEVELARAEAEGVGLIVMSHHASSSVSLEQQIDQLEAITVLDPRLEEMWARWMIRPSGALDATAFRQLLAASPNVLAHVAGHAHNSQINVVCPNGSILRGDPDSRCAPGPEGQPGYWEIVTPAIVSFPHQGRLLELVHVAGRQAALYVTNLDPRIPAGSFAELGRWISRAFEAPKGWGWYRMGARFDRNALLPLVLPPAVAAAFEAATLPDALESETTLLDSHPALPALPVWVE